jgi:hypothetical protein
MILSMLTFAVACVPPGTPVDFEVVFESTVYARDLDGREDLVIRTEEDWCDFWSRAHGAFTEPPPCDNTAADFEVQTILVATMHAPSGCFNVFFDDVTAGDAVHSLVASVREVAPGPGCMCTMSFTTPMQAIVVANPVSEVSFLREGETLACE